TTVAPAFPTRPLPPLAAAVLVLSGLRPLIPEVAMRLLLVCLVGLLAVALLLLPWASNAAPPAGKYALLVGVNEYDHDRLPPLRYAVADVTALRDVLERAGYAVVLLTETEAKAKKDDRLRPTKENVESHLQKLARGFPKGGTLLVGLSGHGIQ